MVGSKDTKRKRKESPLQATSNSQQQQQKSAQTSSSANIESSPEIPKRTKVQAQRKFAQGQNAPTSSYNSAIVTPSCSNGPNTPASRDPPIEILPNKRPKTEDFLTFLCFRGTSDLPPHLDFLNQGETKTRAKSASAANKKSNKITKTVKQGKKGRPKGSGKAKSPSKVTKPALKTSAASTGASVASVNAETEKNTSIKSSEVKSNKSVEKSADLLSTPQGGGDISKTTTIPFAVRKRAEQVPDGNRVANSRSGRQLRNAKPSLTTTVTTTTANDNEKCNISQETITKRRSNRTTTKETKTIVDDAVDDDVEEDEDEDEYFSARDEIVKPDETIAQETVTSDKKPDNKRSKAPTPQVQQQQQDKTVVQSKKPVDEIKDMKKESRTVLARKSNNTKENTTQSCASPTNSKAVGAKEPSKRGLKMEGQLAKDKAPPVKRPRQKESPIFIPSPEPSGRMTRQRAFFEPVKVPHRSDDEAEENISKTLSNEDEKPPPSKSETTLKAKEVHTSAADRKSVLISTSSSSQNVPKTEAPSKTSGASDLKVFDFSSDDEQPLAKAIKLKSTTVTGGKTDPDKKSTTSPNVVRGGRKAQTNKITEDIKEQEQSFQQKKIEKMNSKESKNEKNIGIHITSDDVEEIETAKVDTTTTGTGGDETQIVSKTKTIATQKRGKLSKDSISTIKETDIVTKSVESVVLVEQKRPINARQPRKRTKANDPTQILNGEDDPEEQRPHSPDAPQSRNQRPTRKTKEAATIYMGIIGHKLQLADDEDDDLSLNSFPDLPNVKEVEKMEIELKKNAVQTTNNADKTNSSVIVSSSTVPKLSKIEEPESLPVSKPTAVRRGRPPKQTKQTAPTGSSASAPKINKRVGSSISPKKLPEGNKSVADFLPSQKSKDEISEKLDSDDEDFLLNKEVNVTKRNLAKSFSDSDDEPLAIKVQVKTTVDKESDRDASQPSASVAQILHNTTPSISTMMSESTVPPAAALQPISTLNMQKIISTPPPTSTSLPITTPGPVNSSPTLAMSQHQQQQQQLHQQSSSAHPHPVASPFKPSEKKSPIPTSKILNVPATYGTPPPTAPVNIAGVINPASYGKTYIPTQPPGPYHPPLVNVRPTVSGHAQMVPVRIPVGAVPVGATTPGHQMVPIPPQTPIKYQTPPTTYPPPIEAYPSPKINPNFLTPKFDRMSLPRSNNFPSPSPVKFEATSTATPTSKGAMTGNSTVTATPKTPSNNTPIQVVAGNASASAAAAAAVVPSTSAGAVAGADANSAVNIAELLKDNLMPSKEESGKIFGIASVSLAQSSGPDNTKCTLGKCGSIHKPVLGPVVPTEGYIGDQMSSKERRKAKVNMTHEQIQKWLIECSSNPDEIQDDLDDDFDDNLRPNMTTPPLTRDDKESTSFSSSSKATRDLGKSESAWSTKGPSLKATPVVATGNRKEDKQTTGEVAINSEVVISTSEDKNTPENVAAISQPQKLNTRQNVNANANASESKLASAPAPTPKDNPEQKITKETTTKDNSLDEKLVEKPSKSEKGKDKDQSAKNSKATVAASANDSNQNRASPSGGKQGGRKKNTSTAGATEAKTAGPGSLANQPKTGTSLSSNATTPNTGSGTKTPKRTPVYNQKSQKQIELKETTTTSHRKSAPFSYGAFSADNEKSVYSFDKDDDDDEEENTSKSKPSFRQSRQGRRDSQPNDESTTSTPTNRISPTKRRAAAAAAEKANKDLANASQNSSVSLTLSPAENCKHVKVSLDSEKQVAASSQQSTGPSNSGKATKGNVKKTTETTDNRTTITTGEQAGKQQSNKKDPDSDSDGHTFYIPLQGSGTGKDNNGSIQGVAVKLGREGPDGPNQKVIMHATLVTKAQIGVDSTNSSSDVAQTLENVLATNDSGSNKKNAKTNANSNTNTNANVASTSAAAASASNSASSSGVKNSSGSAAQSRFKSNANVSATGTGTGTAISTKEDTGSAAAAGGGSGLVRVNSNSSLLSGSAKSRVGTGGNTTAANQSAANKKFKDDTPIKMANNTAFPRHDDPTQMVEAPIFRPTEKEFADPIEFIERITPIAARFGICKIIPPSTFKPECRISDDMRFTAYNQYVHKMLHRWGPSAKELSAIKKYLATQSIVMNHPPWIGGMEVDLPRLYHTVQELGGLKEVIEKKKWARVAEEMCIPKLAQDRVTKLDDIYCKYLLPYDTLSPAERQKLFDEVEADWAKREARARRNADRFVNTESVSNEEDDDTTEDDEESEEEVDGVSMECIVKGRSMALNQFYRIARNTMALWFKNTEPTVNEVEAEFWRHVAVRDSHVCVHSGSIDSSGWGYGFPSPGPKGKGSNYARHPWNLKILTNNPGSVLRSLGPVMGVTVPTLHVGMLFSACCWYRDPHGLSWIEYLHTGASKLWYGIPDDQSANFRAALTSLIPTHCQNKTIWLPCDTVMVPPHMLTDRGVSLCRIEQRPGEFIVVFPRAYTSSLSTGYVVSESVYFATTSWLDLAKDDFRDIHESCEPAMFSLEQLLFALGHDQRVLSDTLEQMLPMLHEVCEKESAAREQLKAAGVTSTEMVYNEKGAKGKKQIPPFKSVESECDLCRANLYISMVRTDDGNVYCLQHALKNLNNGNIQAKQCKLIHAYNVDDIEKLIKTLNDRIQQKRSSGNKKSK